MPYTKVFDRGYTNLITKNGAAYASFPNVLEVTRQGEKGGNWRERIKKRQDATTPFSAVEYKVSSIRKGTCNARIIDPDGLILVSELWQGQSHVCDGMPDDLSSDFSEADGKALQRLYRKIEGQLSSTNGLQILGELRETIHMIRHPADAIWKSLETYNHLLSKRKKGISKGLSKRQRLDAWKGIIAGSWLEISFGWKPALMDCRDIAEAAARFTRDLSRDKPELQSYDEVLTVAPISFSSQVLGNSVAVVVDSYMSVQTTCGVKYRCGFNADVLYPEGSLGRLAQLAGFSPNNFVPTVWELIPFSFLVDYFVNVGDIIGAACTSTAGVTWKNKTTRIFTTKSVVTTARGEFNPVWASLGYSTPFVGSDFGSVTKSRSTIVRSVLDRLDLPSIEFSLPGKPNRYANIGALLANFAPSKFR